MVKKRTIKPKGKSSGLLGNPKAKALVDQAAELIGCSAQELADYVVDSGLLATPITDGITDSYTLDELGKRLWATMQEQPRHRRQEWYQGLIPRQQAAVVTVMRDAGFSSQTIASDFAISAIDVTDIWNEHATKLGEKVIGLRLDTIAGNIQLAAERAQQMAVEKGDASTYWRIAKELVAAFQSIGIVDRAIHKVEVNHNFDGERERLVNEMLNLERKKQTRQEEIKRIECEVSDEVPVVDA